MSDTYKPDVYMHPMEIKITSPAAMFALVIAIDRFLKEDFVGLGFSETVAKHLDHLLSHVEDTIIENYGDSLTRFYKKETGGRLVFDEKKEETDGTEQKGSC